MSKDMSNESNATTTKTREYKSKAITTKLVATSRASVKINDNFYTVEMTEERTLSTTRGVNLAKEQQLLWDSVNNSVDNQIIDIKNAFAGKH